MNILIDIYGQIQPGIRAKMAYSSAGIPTGMAAI